MTLNNLYNFAASNDGSYNYYYQIINLVIMIILSSFNTTSLSNCLSKFNYIYLISLIIKFNKCIKFMSYINSGYNLILNTNNHYVITLLNIVFNIIYNFLI